MFVLKELSETKFIEEYDKNCYQTQWNISVIIIQGSDKTFNHVDHSGKKI